MANWHPARLIKYSAIGVAALVFLPILLLTFLLYTETGTGWVFGYLQRIDLINYNGLQGSFNKGVKVESVRYTSGSTSLSADGLRVKADLHKLLFSQVHISVMSAETLNIQITAEADTPTEPFDAGMLNSALGIGKPLLPFEMFIDNLAVKNLVISQGDKQYQARDVSLKASANERGLKLKNASAEYQGYPIVVSGHLYRWPNPDISLLVKVGSAETPDTLTAQAGVKANARQFSIDLTTRGPAVSQSQLILNQWLSSPHINLQTRLTTARLTLPGNRPLELANTTLTATGNPSDLTLAVEGYGEVNGFALGDIQVNAVLRPQQLTVERATVEHPAGKAAAKGQLTWPGNVPDWQGQLQLADFNLNQFHPRLPENVSGNVDISASYNSKLNFNIKSENLTAKLQSQPVAAVIHAEKSPTGIRFERLQLTSQNNHLTLSGEASQNELDLTFAADITNPRIFLPASDGSLKTSGTIRGSTHSPDITLQVAAEEVRWQNLRLNQLDASVSVVNGKFIGEKSFLTSRQFEFKGLEIALLQIYPSGHWKNPALAVQLNIENLADRQVSLASDIGLRVESGLTEVVISHTLLTGSHIGDWKQPEPATLSIQKNRWSVDGFCLEEQPPESGGRLCLTNQFAASGYNATLDVADWPSGMLYTLGLVPLNIKGDIDLNLTLRGSPENLVGKASLSLSNDAEPLTITPPNSAQNLTLSNLSAEFVLKDKQLQGSASTQLNDADTISAKLTLTQPFSAESTLDGWLEYNIHDLQPYQSFFPELEELTGTLEGTVSVQNTLKNPRLYSTAKLHIPRVTINSLGVTWQDITATVNSDNIYEHRVLLNLTAGEGQLGGKGTLTLGENKAWLSELDISGENALLVDLPGQYVIANPNLSLRGINNSIDVTGDVTIPSARFSINAPLAGHLELTPDAVIHQTESTTKPGMGMSIRYNIQLLLGKDVNLDAYGLKTRLEGSLNLSRQPHASVLAQGELRLVDGTYKAYGQDLSITRGILQFAGLPDRPQIALTANRKIGDVVAGLHVNGMADNLSTHLYSKPTMNDSEILSYIVRGKPLSEATSSDQNALSGLALGYALGQATPVTDKLSEWTGLDDIIIESEQGLESIGLGLGKYVTPELYVRYGLDVIDRVSKVLVRYQITQRLFLETEASKGQSVDLIYRVE